VLDFFGRKVIKKDEETDAKKEGNILLLKFCLLWDVVLVNFGRKTYLESNICNKLMYN